jgi:hypothetical protein
MEVRDTFGVELPQTNFNKLMAAVEIVTTDVFYNDLPAFIRLCNVLYNGTLDIEQFDPADAAEISWGITEALLLWPPDPDDEEPFAEDILAYIGEVVKDEGIMLPPDVLRLGIGLDDSLWDQVQGEFSDDPEMWEAIHQKETDKTDDINATIKQRLTALLRILDSLPLANGKAEESIKRMLAQIEKSRRAGAELKPINAADASPT